MPSATAVAFRQLLGPIDTVAPSAPKVTRTFVIDGVRYERLLISGALGDIPAYSLCLDGPTERRPGLLALHSHDRQFDVGKSAVAGLYGDPSHALGLIAARLGFVVLAPDFPGFEDHRPSLSERKRNYALQGEGYERLMAMNALLWGRTLQGRIASDLHACVSVLSADPRVDPSRIFAAGHSFGGQEAIWTTVIDDRISGCLSSCGFSLVRLIAERNISHNMALYVPGLLPHLDFDEVLLGLGSRPFYAIAAEADAIYPVDGVRAAEARSQAAGRSASQNRFQYLEGPHAFATMAVRQGLEWLTASSARTVVRVDL